MYETRIKREMPFRRLRKVGLSEAVVKEDELGKVSLDK